MKLGLISAGMALMPTLAQAAFVSGSTGADGAFSPTVNTQVVLPPSGILNYTTVNIPTGVTVTFKKNTTNTPVVILASGNVTISGSINVNGADGKASGAAGDGVLADDGTPGAGGPGGFGGGWGGTGTTMTGAATGTNGGAGLGPGGGLGAIKDCSGTWWGTPYQCLGGSGGGFGTVGSMSGYSALAGGAIYGSSQLLPLIGGSGGGGGAGRIYNGGGGGGGGGAILIASSGMVNIAGTVNANGGVGGAVAGTNGGGVGGGGAGGAIRIVATSIAGNGALNATGNSSGVDGSNLGSGGAGGVGRIRLEAEVFTRTAASNPAHTQGLPGSVFVAGLPTLRISSVAGADVPTEPTGNADVTLPSTMANPVAVAFTTTGVPVGNTVKLSLKPASGNEVTATSAQLAGDMTTATASVNINFPNGTSTLQATVTYTITLAMGEALSIYALGERVEKITLASTLGSKEPTVTLITVSGKEFVVPAGVLAAMPS